MLDENDAVDAVHIYIHSPTDCVYQIDERD
jgi:hypothetical protein